MRYSNSVDIASTPEVLFRITQDYSRRLEWDPFLSAATLLGGASKADLGVKARCVAKRGLAMETIYVSFNPPRTTAVRMTSGPWILKDFAGTWRFEELSAGHTRVVFTYSLQTRLSWAAWLVTPLLASLFASQMRKRLAALKMFVERSS